MVFESKLIGNITIDEAEIFEFPGGLLGFEDKKRFFFMKVLDSGFPFPLEIMHSYDSNNLAFFVADPSYIVPEYSILVSPDDIKDIDFQDISDLVLRVILRFEKGKVFCNLVTPIVLNAKTKKGKQLILNAPEDLLDVEISIEKGTEIKKETSAESVSENPIKLASQK